LPHPSLQPLSAADRTAAVPGIPPSFDEKACGALLSLPMTVDSLHMNLPLPLDDLPLALFVLILFVANLCRAKIE
jgi:hypothetical protein